MREILFRGKRVDNGEWVYGDLLHPDIYGNGYSIEDFTKEKSNCYDVIPESVSEFTGLTDKNGKKIFEGDIVKLYLIDGEEIGVIKYNDKMCRFMFFTKDGSYSFDDTDDFEIIGNTHDNPELLKGGNNNA